MGSNQTATACSVNQHGGHAFGSFQGRTREGLYLQNRRGMLKTGLAGIGGLSLAQLLQTQQSRCLRDAQFAG